MKINWTVCKTCKHYLQGWPYEETQECWLEFGDQPLNSDPEESRLVPEDCPFILEQTISEY